MTDTISLPIWLVLAAAVLALWSLFDRFLMPSVRWFLRRRINRIVNELNTRLQFQIPAVQQTKRRVLVDRLTFDPKIMEAVEAEADRLNMPREMVLGRVERYAREIVPAFNAYAYFRVGHYLARRIAQLLYRVRLGYSDDKALAGIDPQASIVFVMNHRSNMDYVVVAYLAASRSALSYAVGEWARTWPLKALVKSLGAYFVRRNSRDSLYRQVLARYVQMATESGVVQAVYPEGGLSRDGRLQPLKLGLISYMLSAFDPDGGRDLVFIPVGINYDRVLEDRTLVRMLDSEAPRRSAGFALATTVKWIFHNFGLVLRRRWFRYGYACVNFGTPISMRSYTRAREIDFSAMDPDARFEAVARLGDELLEAIGEAIPILPVSLVATVFLLDREKRLSELEIKASAQRLMDEARSRNAYIHIPRSDQDYAIAVGPAHAGAAAFRGRRGGPLPGKPRRDGDAAILRERDRALPAGRLLNGAAARSGGSAATMRCPALRGYVVSVPGSSGDPVRVLGRPRAVARTRSSTNNSSPSIFAVRRSSSKPTMMSVAPAVSARCAAISRLNLTAVSAARSRLSKCCGESAPCSTNLPAQGCSTTISTVAETPPTAAPTAFATSAKGGQMSSARSSRATSG